MLIDHYKIWITGAKVGTFIQSHLSINHWDKTNSVARTVERCNLYRYPGFNLIYVPAQKGTGRLERAAVGIRPGK